MGPVAVNAALLGDASLFTKIVKQTVGSFQKDCYCALGELICLQDLVVQERDLIEALTKSKRLYQIHANLSGFEDGFLQGNPGRSGLLQIKYLRRWLDALILRCLDNLEKAHEKDARTLVKIILKSKNEPFRQFILYQSIRGFVKNFHNNGTFINALMIELCLHLQHLDSSEKYLKSPPAHYRACNFQFRSLRVRYLHQDPLVFSSSWGLFMG